MRQVHNSKFYAWLIKNDFLRCLCVKLTAVSPCEWKVLFNEFFLQQPVFLTFFNFAQMVMNRWLEIRINLVRSSPQVLFFWVTHSIVIMFQSCYIEMLSNDRMHGVECVKYLEIVLMKEICCSSSFMCCCFERMC